MSLVLLLQTHTETTVSGTAMTKAYHRARHIIKKAVNADENDIY
jgi:selenocysteine lyase/cysteine desulfurase